jgi:hypothetical protein
MRMKKMAARWRKIQETLEHHAHHLRKQGSLVSKPTASGRRVWVVRFWIESQGRSVCRSIYIGGDDQPELLARTRELLKHYRERATWAKEIATYSRLVAVANATLKRLSRRE